MARWLSASLGEGLILSLRTAVFAEVAVQAALGEALAGRTALVIAHRLSTVRAADLILVLEDGRIVERGTHAELVDAGGRYQELYRTQFDQPTVAV